MAFKTVAIGQDVVEPALDGHKTGLEGVDALPVRAVAERRAHHREPRRHLGKGDAVRLHMVEFALHRHKARRKLVVDPRPGAIVQLPVHGDEPGPGRAQAVPKGQQGVDAVFFPGRLGRGGDGPALGRLSRTDRRRQHRRTHTTDTYRKFPSHSLCHLAFSVSFRER